MNFDAFPFFMKAVHGQGEGLNKFSDESAGGKLLQKTFQTNMGAARNMDNFKREERGNNLRDDAIINHLLRPFARARDIRDRHHRTVFI